MDPDKDTSKQEPMAELRSLRQEVTRLKGRLSRLAEAAETYKYASLIIEHSPAI